MTTAAAPIWLLVRLAYSVAAGQETLMSCNALLEASSKDACETMRDWYPMSSGKNMVVKAHCVLKSDYERGMWWIGEEKQ